MTDNTHPAVESKMRVVAFTAFAGRGGNPYNWLLYSHMNAQVIEFKLKTLLCEKCDILHLHWPESSLNIYRNPVPAFVRARLLLFRIDQYRSRGARVVWTVHNLRSHEQFHPRLEAWFWREFIARLDGVIALSAAGLDAARRKFPRLSGLPAYVIPHGHYRGEYANDPELNARERLGIDSAKKVILYFGQIRRYKNIPRLLDAFSQLPGDDYLLYLAGKPANKQDMRELEEAAARDNRVRLHPEHIPAGEVQLFFRAADLVVLPFREILNSGSTILALSFNRPVLVPDHGAMGELQELVGREWVRTYQGDLSEGELAEAMQWARTAKRAEKAPLEKLEWAELAAQTLEAFKGIVRANGAAVTGPAAQSESVAECYR